MLGVLNQLECSSIDLYSKKLAMVDDVQVMINYYIRMGYSQHIQDFCAQHLQKHPKDLVLLFWHAFGLLLEGSYLDALRELQGLLEQKEVEFAVIVTMLYAHCRFNTIDKQEVQNLEQRLEIVEKYSSEKALFLAATLYSHLNGIANVKKANELISKILQVQPHFVPAQCLSGWLGMIFDKDGEKIHETKSSSYYLNWDRVESSLHIFDEVLAKGNHIDALLGKAYYFELKEDFTKAIDELNRVIIMYPWYLPALCEKGRLGIIMQDWVLGQETGMLILQKDPKNIEGLRITIHVNLCIDNDIVHIVHLMDDLLRYIEERERYNGDLYYKVAYPLARIAGRGRSIVIQKTLVFIEKAKKILEKQAILSIEMADQQIFLGDYKSALTNYRIASQLDELNIEPMYGVIQCLLVLGEIEEAEKHLEFLVEISISTGKSPSLCYLMAQLAWVRNKDYLKCKDMLVDAITLHIKTIRKKKDYYYYAELNPERLLGIAYLFSLLSKHECKDIHVDRNFCLQQSMDVLELVLSSIPGLLIGHLMLAEVLILLDDLDSAEYTLQTALNLDHTCTTGQLLLTQVQIQLGKFDMAKKSLDQALSDNFIVRETVKYHVLMSQILMEAQEKEEALKILESAMFLPGMKESKIDSYRAYYSSTNYKLIGEPTSIERVLVYLIQVEIHMRLFHFVEATKIIHDAMNQFMATPEHVLVVITNSKLALKREDVNTALAMLKQVPVESSYFIQAKMTIADIYMNHLHDNVMFANCYKELVQVFPNAKTYMMLGDAFMKIDELGKAINAYEHAMKKSSKDASMAAQVGKALVTTHNYEKAIEHYKTAMNNIEESSMKFVLYYDLADLYYKLKKYEEAEILLNDMLAQAYMNNHQNSKLRRTTSLILCLKGSLLLSKVQNLLGKSTTLAEERRRSSTMSRYLHHYQVMFSAKNLQSNMVSKFHGQLEDTIKEQNGVAADIYFQFAQECKAQKDFEKTITLLHEALKYNPSHTTSILALARIHLSRGDVSECEQKCASILKMDPFNSEAGDILVHLMLYRELYESAIIHFKQNLERDANHYSSLAQLIRLLRSAGKIDEAQQYVLRAEKALPTFHTNGGLYFCKGLLARYSNNLVEALQMFNFARADPDWGRPAIYLLIEIYLNIDNQLVWDESSLDGTTMSNEEGIKAAWKLLGENRLLDGKSIKQLLLECYATMATRQKADIEFALGRLSETISKDEQQVSILLAMATAWTLLKQTSKAKNQLRAISRMVYKWEDGEEFERAWLMLANIFIQNGKHDAAEELCRKCLKYNKDCSRAWEYLGLMTEKGHSYNEVLGYYENAWKCQQEACSSMGYRLALIYLKEKRFIEAISICKKVLKVHPNYPQIKKDILDKARLGVRP